MVPPQARELSWCEVNRRARGAIALQRELRERILEGAAGDTLPAALQADGRGPWGRAELFGTSSEGARIGRTTRSWSWDPQGRGFMSVHDDPRLYGGTTPERPDRPSLALLSGRERQVLELLGQQLTHTEIAVKLRFSLRQVRTAIESANRKLAEQAAALRQMRPNRR